MLHNKTQAARWVLAVCLLTIPATIFARRGSAQTQGGDKGGLAMVAIPAYVDTTNSADYGYLSGSVTDAVNASMQDKFDYARANQKAVEGETKKLWKPNRVPSDQEVRQIAILTHSDYVVVGSYSLSANKKQIIFNTRIFIAPDKFINVPAFTNNADATLFDATNKVATEIVKAIETDALQRASTKPEAVKDGEKIALSKAKTAETASESESPSSGYRSSEKYIALAVGYHTNVVERYTQFYQYPSSAVNINADWRFTSNLMLYGKIALPQTPTGDLISPAFKNNGNQTLGMEFGDRMGNYVFGINYRNFSDVNPAGLLFRDLLTWTSSAYIRTHFHLFSAGGFYFGLDLDSYLDLLNAKTPVLASTDIATNTLGLLWNVEGALNISYFLPVVNASLTGILGAAYSIADSTSRSAVTTSGVTAFDKTNRSSTFAGMRLGLELEKWFNGISLKVEAYHMPSAADKFQPYDAQNQKKKSYSFVMLTAGYRFDF